MMTAEQFNKALDSFITAEEKIKLKRFFKGDDAETEALGVRFGNVFKTAKAFKKMPLEEIEKLLESKYYEVRMGAVSIMDFQAREKSASESKKKTLFDLYLRRHDRLNNWDFVDRSAAHVIGAYLFDKDRSILYQLAKSKNIWERRTAIVSTAYFIRKGETEDTFKIAEMLMYDKEELINKAVGSWIREAGKKEPQKLKKLLDKYAVDMPRISLRYAIEKLDKASKQHYLSLKKLQKT